MLLIHYRYDFWDYIYIFSDLLYNFYFSFHLQHNMSESVNDCKVINNEATTWSYRGWDYSSVIRDLHELGWMKNF